MECRYAQSTGADFRNQRVLGPAGGGRQKGRKAERQETRHAPTAHRGKDGGSNPTPTKPSPAMRRQGLSRNRFPKSSVALASTAVHSLPERHQKLTTQPTAPGRNLRGSPKTSSFPIPCPRPCHSERAKAGARPPFLQTTAPYPIQVGLGLALEELDLDCLNGPGKKRKGTKGQEKERKGRKTTKRLQHRRRLGHCAKPITV